MLSAVSASSVLAVVSSASPGVTFIAGVVGGLAAGIVLYLLVYRYSARRLPEVRAEDAPELVTKPGGQMAAFACSTSIGIVVGFVSPAVTHLSAGPLLQVVHLMGAAMVGVSVVGIAWLSPRLRAAQNAAAA